MAKTTKKTAAKTSKKEVAEEPKKQEETPEVEDQKKVGENANIETAKTDESKTSKKELESEAKRIKRTIERTQERIGKEKQKCEEWEKEGRRLSEVNDQKFESDQVKKILQLKEDDNVSAIEILLDFYQSEVERLTAIKNEKEAAGESGEFSNDYKKFLQQRTERYEKRKANINRSWIVYSENYIEKKIPPLEEKIADLNQKLQKVEEQIASKSEVVINV